MFLYIYIYLYIFFIIYRYIYVCGLKIQKLSREARVAHGAKKKALKVQPCDCQISSPSTRLSQQRALSCLALGALLLHKVLH